MARRLLGAMIIVLGVNSLCFAADCASSKQAMLDLTARFAEVRTHAEKLTITCAFQGIDEKAVDALGVVFSDVYRAAGADATPTDGCVRSDLELQAALKFIANGVGESFGRAVLACTEKGQALSTQAGPPDADRNKQAKDLMMSYIKP